jgi:hypothetical protein
MMDIQKLVGEILKTIDVDPEKNKILLTTESGREIMIYHEQDCCESVRIEDTEGNWHELVGKVIVEATEDAQDGDEGDEWGLSHTTKTALTFKVDGATVISRWIGESNGYYSESVDIKELR